MTIGSDGAESLAGSPQTVSSEPGAIARRSVFGLAAQLTPLLVNIVMTPYVIHGLGIDRYGVFLLIMGVAQLLGSFDGGVTASAQRYFSIFAGRQDRTATTRLLFTTTTIVGGIALLIGTTMWLLAGTLARLLHMPLQLQGETIFLVRVGAAVFGIALIRNVFAALLQANNRFALTMLTYALGYAIYTPGIILTVQHGWGLRGAGLTILTQQILSSFVLVPASLRYCTRSGVSFYTRPELKELISYSGKMQAVSVANLFLAQVDAIIIAAILPVRVVTLYRAGAGFVEQVRSVPGNAVAPMQTALSHSYAVRGDEGLNTDFARLQRTWLLGISGWCSAAIGAAYFGVSSWLGTPGHNDFRVSGLVATVLMLGTFFFLGTRVLTTALNVAGSPGFEARMGGVMVIVNVTLTVALVWFGPLGVVAGTAVSQIAGALWIERAVRRRHPYPMRSFLREVPVKACLATAATVFALEWLIHPWVPYGAVGLLTCALPAIPGLLVYLRLGIPADRRQQLMAQVRSRLRLRTR